MAKSFDVHFLIDRCEWDELLLVLGGGETEHGTSAARKQRRALEFQLNELDADGNFPLHRAIDSSAPDDVILELMRFDPTAASKTGRGGSLPLHLACQRQLSVEVIEALIRAHPSALDWKNAANYTPRDYVGGESLRVKQFIDRPTACWHQLILDSAADNDRDNRLANMHQRVDAALESLHTTNSDVDRMSARLDDVEKKLRSFEDMRSSSLKSSVDDLERNVREEMDRIDDRMSVLEDDIQAAASRDYMARMASRAHQDDVHNVQKRAAGAVESLREEIDTVISNFKVLGVSIETKKEKDKKKRSKKDKLQTSAPKAISTPKVDHAAPRSSNPNPVVVEPPKKNTKDDKLTAAVTAQNGIKATNESKINDSAPVTREGTLDAFNKTNPVVNDSRNDSPVEPETFGSPSPGKPPLGANKNGQKNTDQILASAMESTARYDRAVKSSPTTPSSQAKNPLPGSSSERKVKPEKVIATTTEKREDPVPSTSSSSPRIEIKPTQTPSYNSSSSGVVLGPGGVPMVVGEAVDVQEYRKMLEMYQFKNNPQASTAKPTVPPSPIPAISRSDTVRSRTVRRNPRREASPNPERNMRRSPEGRKMISRSPKSPISPEQQRTNFRGRKDETKNDGSRRRMLTPEDSDRRRRVISPENARGRRPIPGA